MTRTRTWHTTLAGLCLGLGFAVPEPALAEPKQAAVLRINNTNAPPYTTRQRDGFLDVIAAESFRRAGARLQLIELPAERGLLNANAGIDDGDLTRIAGLEKKYPNLVRVDEVLIDWVFSAFSRHYSGPAKWDSLRQRSIGHIRGWKIYETALAGAGNVTQAQDALQLFRLLALGRIDVALYERALGAHLLKTSGQHSIRALDPPIYRKDMYIYLNRKHAALAPRIATALRDLKKEGVYQRVYNEKIRPYRGSLAMAQPH